MSNLKELTWEHHKNAEIHSKLTKTSNFPALRENTMQDINAHRIALSRPPEARKISTISTNIEDF